MTASVVVTDLRVFSTEQGGGNPCGLVVSDSPLGKFPSQRGVELARAAGLHEIAVVDTGEWDKKRLLHARIFTSARELEFAGHPLVGLAWWYSQSMGLHEPWKAKTSATEVFAWRERDFGWIRVPPPPISPGPKDSFEVLRALRAEALDLSPRMPLARCGYGEQYLIVAFAEPERVLEIEPDTKQLAELEATRAGVYCFAMRHEEVTARFFAPALGVDEDPGTGSGAIALGAFLSRYWRHAPRDYVIKQGHRTGSPCELYVRRPEGGIELGGRVVEEGERVLG